MFDKNPYWMSLSEITETDDFKNGVLFSSSGLIPYINQLGENLVVAEIGVAFGINMMNNIAKCSIAKYIAIDPFDEYQDWGPDIPYGTMTKERMNGVGDKFLKNLSEYDRKDIVQHIHKKSDDAKDDIAGESLDFLFIDGNHAREFVKNDCINYWSKIKKNGIMSGHDWDAATVQQGVRDFLEINNISEDKLIQVYEKNTAPCWLIYKE